MLARSTVGSICLATLTLALNPTAPESDAASGPSVRWMAAHSSNYSRRSSRRIDRIVIHTIEGSESSGISWFKNSRSNVSAHYIVSHTGRITQMVRDNDVAWHAGSMNSRSIGIENEGRASRNGWTDVQYRQLAALVRSLCDRYRIPMDRTHIIGHYQVTSRKVDPGRHFNWTRFLQLVRGSSAPVLNPNPNSGGSSTTVQNLSIVETTASSLRVRSAVWGTVLGSVSKGSRFVVRDSRSGWLQIDFRGGQAWIHGNYAKRVTGAQAVEVTARSGLNARSGPSTRNQILTVLSPGGRYVVSAHDAGWVRVQVDQRQAWISSQYVRSIVSK